MLEGIKIGVVHSGAQEASASVDLITQQESLTPVYLVLPGEFFGCDCALFESRAGGAGVACPNMCS